MLIDLRGTWCCISATQETNKQRKFIPSPAECAERLNPPRACRSCVSDNPERSTERPSLVKLCFTSLTLGAFSHDCENTAHASKINENVGFPRSPKGQYTRRRGPPWRTPGALILLAYAMFSLLLPQTCLLGPQNCLLGPQNCLLVPQDCLPGPQNWLKTACSGFHTAC